MIKNKSLKSVVRIQGRNNNSVRGTTLITADTAVTLQSSNKLSAMITGQAVAAYWGDPFGLLCSGARLSIRTVPRSQQPRLSGTVG